MTIAAYSMDLVDISTAESTTGWSEPGTWTAGASPGQDNENFIQGSYSNSKAFNATSVGGMGFTIGNTTMSTPTSVFFWHYWASPQTLDTETNGGIRAMVGSATNAFYGWKVGGKDTYTYGGWVNYAVDPSITPDYTVGSPTTTKGFFGMVINNLNAVSKGSPFLCDAIRYGRTFQVTNGDSTTPPTSPRTQSNYGNFNDAAIYNDANDATTGYNRWGLFQAIDGGYLMKGLFLMGTASTLVNFVDTNKVISIQNSKKVASNFNAFEVRNASSTVSWTNVNISSLTTTPVSRGDFIVTDNATISLNTCVFTDMGTFTFQSNTTITSCTFRRCGLITRGGATITSCIFDSTYDSTGALSIANPSTSLTGCTFTSSGTKHAIIITATGTYTFTNNTFTGYASSNGSTGNEVVYNNSSGSVTIQHSGTTGTISYRNGSGASTTVSTSVSITIKVTDESNNNLQTAYVYIIDDGSAEVMNTTTNSSGIATGSYTGAYSSGTLRVRKYGYKPYTGSVGLSSTVNTTIVLVTDPVQDASPQDLSSYFTISTGAKTITHSSGTSTYTVKEFFKWLANTFAASSYMDDTFPMLADTATVFRFTNSWTFGDTSTDYKYLTGGAITSSDSNALWSNLYTIGTQYRSSQIYIVQNSGEITPWWSTGNIDVLILVKSSGSLIDSGLVTVLSRDSDCLYDHNIVDLSGGGRTPVGINTFADTNYTETGDIYLQVASVTGFDAGNYAYGNTSTASGRIQYVDTTNTRLYLCQVEGTFQTSETIYERTSRTTGNTGTSTTNSASTAYTNVVAAYTDIKYAFVQRQFSGGTVSGGPFQVGETLTQSGSGWTGKFAYIDASDVLYAEHTSGTANGTGQLTGSTSGATYTPTATASQTSVSIDLGNGNGPQPYNVIVNCAGRTIEQVYRYLKYITRHNSTATINNDGGEEYRSASPGTYSDSKQAPLGTFAGGKFFGARGIYIYNMDSADANDYQLTDANDVTQTPPSTVSTIVTVKDLSTGLAIESANVLLWVTDNSNYFYEASVSITGSGTTATVSHTAHGLTSGDYVIIEGVTNDDDYNGVFEITKTSDNEYTYTTSETLGASPATGTITATLALISGTTNSSGIISDTRGLSSDQPVTGWVRKSSASPYYQQGNISGTIDSVTGLSVTLQLARDE